MSNLTCVSGDLPSNYMLQTSGDFTVNNLADLSTDAHDRRAQLRAEGVQTGHFSTWRQHAGSPPFPPPIDVLCQVIRFDTTAHARAFVASMKPDLSDLEDTAMGWVPSDGNNRVTETTADQQAPQGARTFTLDSSDQEAKLQVYVVVDATGPYVQTVWVGDRDDEATMAQAVSLEKVLVSRATVAAPAALTSASP